MDDRTFLAQQVAEWIEWGDLTPDIDIGEAVNVLLSAYERSKAAVTIDVSLPWWVETFHKIMMEQDMQLRFAYLHGVRPRTLQ